jgi:hypothetical protein
MTRIDNPINNSNFLSASLEISRSEGGTCLATLGWPRGGLGAQNEVSLGPVISKLSAYQTSLDFFVDGLPETDHSKNYTPEQIDMANMLWRAINQGNIADLLNELVDFAGVRPIMIHIEVTQLDYEAVPWELLGTPNCDYIKNKHITLFVCRSKTPSVNWQASRSDQINILLANSQPMPVRAIHTGEEFGAIQDLFRGNNQVAITQSPNVDYYSFCKSLEVQPHILHLACHGIEDKLFFKDGQKDKQEIPHTSIVNAICDTPSIGLVVLNVCHSANLARQLVESGVPAAIGMSTSFTDLAACEFSRWFYLGLQKEKNICQSFQFAIENLQNLSETDRMLWSVPMLYENQEFAPFVDFLNEIRADMIPPSWSRKDFQKIASTLEEFINAYGRLHPDPRWTTYHWDLETKRIILLHLSAYSAVKSLSDILPQTYNTDAQDMILEIRKAQNSALRAFEKFIETIPAWKTLEISSEYGQSQLKHFLSSGEILMRNIRQVLLKIEPITKGRGILH